jgi:3-methyl-2-oxobutanoate hydroxymethyltransferase
VTLADIAHHVRAVRRGTTDAYLLADLPYGTYPTPATALANARHLVAAGADGVKLEGPQLDTSAYLAAHGIEVCGHVGFEPQHHGQAALKGKQAAEAVRIYDEARAIAESGAFMLVLELVPEELGALISQDVAIPTIGIGAGRATDGQVLVITDVFGFTERRFRHNRRYAEIGQAMREAARRYRDDVRGGGFPGPENAAHMPHEELEAIRRTLRPAD